MSRWFLLIITVSCLIAGGTAGVSAQERKPGEYQVKALFLYNFINFVEWPANSSFRTSARINVCIIGNDPFEDALDEIRDESVKGKKLVIRLLRASDEPKGCHLLFIPASATEHTGHILRSIRETGVLTVADTEESVREGAAIGFYIEQKKVHFAVNIDAAGRAGLKISAKLLKLARIVRDN